jgi:hypothetical protein
VTASNVAFVTSNVAYPASLAATFASNAGVFGSNAGAFGSNAGAFGSNTGVFASNTAWWASNSTFFASNTAVSASNTAIATSNQAYSNIFWSDNTFNAHQLFKEAISLANVVAAPTAASNAGDAMFYVQNNTLYSVSPAGAVNCYDPTTTAGDLSVYGGTTSVRLPRGTSNQYVGIDTTNFASTGGVGWNSFVFGTWYQYTESTDSNITSANATLVSRVTMTTPVLDAGSYRVRAFCTTKTTNANRRVRVLCFVNSSNDASNIWLDSQLSAVFANTVEGAYESTAVQVLESATHTVNMFFSTANTTASLPTARLEIFRVM